MSDVQTAYYRLVLSFPCIKMRQTDRRVLKTVPFEVGLKRSDFQAVFGLYFGSSEVREKQSPKSKIC